MMNYCTNAQSKSILTNLGDGGIVHHKAQCKVMKQKCSKIFTFLELDFKINFKVVIRRVVFFFFDSNLIFQKQKLSKVA